MPTLHCGARRCSGIARLAIKTHEKDLCAAGSSMAEASWLFWNVSSSASAVFGEKRRASDARGPFGWLLRARYSGESWPLVFRSSSAIYPINFRLTIRADFASHRVFALTNGRAVVPRPRASSDQSRLAETSAYPCKSLRPPTPIVCGEYRRTAPNFKRCFRPPVVGKLRLP